MYHMHHPDVLLLDINLPFLDGLSLAKKIRESDKTVKIIMLTAHTEKEKLLKATELKLTKYLIKPIAPKLFKETLEVLSRDLMQNPSHFIHISNECIWDNKQETLSINDIHIPLNNKEHRLLKLLITSNKNSTISYEDIMVAVWEDSFERDISIDSIKNLVSQLRKKLPEHCISSVYGKGYVLK